MKRYDVWTTDFDTYRWQNPALINSTVPLEISVRCDLGTILIVGTPITYYIDNYFVRREGWGQARIQNGGLTGPPPP